MYDTILLRYGEIFLKGKNKKVFENKLVRNIKAISGVNEVKLLRARLVVDYFSELVLLRRVLGLVSYSPAVKVEKDLDVICKKAVSLLKGKKGKFKVVTKRSDKRFPLESPEINVEVGKFIESSLKDLEFSFKDPDYILNLEINQDGAYLFTDVFPCFGGLPVGVEGKVTLLYEGFESVVAGWLMMKRGVGLDIFAVKKLTEEDLEILQKFSPKKITVLGKLSGNSLVSGQSFNNLKDYGFSGGIFRPLIAFSSEEILGRYEGIKRV
ncbi:MAG: THUMP domain-containing protein [archaeon]|nr:hypothetical protein [Nanoarchaeota archaeon]